MSIQASSVIAHSSPASAQLGRTAHSRSSRPTRSNAFLASHNQRVSPAHASGQADSQPASWNKSSSISKLTATRRLFLTFAGGLAAKNVPGFGRQRGSIACAAMALEVAVKAAVGDPDRLGDCPFSQRVLMTLEEKHIPYKSTLIDFSNKPQWYLEANPTGKVPALKTPEGWLADSDEITKRLEKEYPEPSLVTPEEKASVGSKIFPSFVGFLKSDDPGDGKEQALLSELEALDKALGEGEGPFIAGDKITQVDAALIPKLYHAKVALKELKGWEFPANLTNVHSYIKAATETESFKKTAAADDLIVKGWLAHEGVKKQV